MEGFEMPKLNPCNLHWTQEIEDARTLLRDASDFNLFTSAQRDVLSEMLNHIEKAMLMLQEDLK